jgi:ribosomal protein RSM22 (predicted rRNA methylase)
MPATHAAVARALRHASDLADLEVRSLLDVGGGTGAAAWAAGEAFPALASATVLDASADALALGRRIAEQGPDVVAAATWRRLVLGSDTVLPQADLVIVSYVLGELPEALQGPLLDAAMTAGRHVLVVEPGTPRGFRAVLAARARLTVDGWHLLAPCPQDGPCPLAAGDDWCHFAVRLERTALHRRLKGGTLGHEDEKFSYAFATRRPASPAPGRVLRHPLTRKGLVQLEVCRSDGTAARTVVTRRDPMAYRAARDAAWGDAWQQEPR